MSNQEIWKDIPNYEGYYQVSNLSRIRSVDRFFISKKGKKVNVKGQIIKHITNGSGYKQVCLYKNGKQKIILVHRLVAISFINNINNKPQINHIDNNPANNKIENLEWTTQSENIRHADKQNRRDFSRSYRKIISIDIKSRETKIYKTINSVKKYGMSPGTVCACLKKNKGFLTYKGKKWIYYEEYIMNKLFIDNQIEQHKQYL